jgi:hypothetical protein
LQVGALRWVSPHFLHRIESGIGHRSSGLGGPSVADRAENDTHRDRNQPASASVRDAPILDFDQALCYGGLSFSRPVIPANFS